jgi:cell division protein FtsB
MSDPARREPPKPLKAFSISLVLSALAFGVLLVGDRGSDAWQRAREEARSLKAEIARLEADNAELSRRVADAEKSDFELEKIAREDLGLVRPDEVVFVLPPETAKPAAAPAPGR